MFYLFGFSSTNLTNIFFILLDLKFNSWLHDLKQQELLNIENPCKQYRSYIFHPITMTLCKSVYIDDFSAPFVYGSSGDKNSSPRLNVEKTCEHILHPFTKKTLSECLS